MSPANEREYQRLVRRLRAVMEAAERADRGDSAELRLSWGGKLHGPVVRGTWRCDPDLVAPIEDAGAA